MAGNFKGNSKLELRRPGESSIYLWDILNKLAAVGIIVGIFCVVCLFFVPVLREVNLFEKQTLEKRQLLQAEELYQKKLLEEVEMLKNDPEYNERIARERMGLVRSNEVIFRFPPLPKPAPAIPENPASAAPRPGQKTASEKM